MTYFFDVSNEAASRRDDSRQPRAQVLCLLRDEGALPRITLARLTGLSPTSITRVVNQLISEGIVAEGATISPTRLGRPATEVALRPDSRFVVGAQIGVGSVSVGLVDLLGRPVDVETFSFARASRPEEVLRLVATFINGFVDRHGRDNILGVGVAAPGPVDAERRRLLLPIHLQWEDVAVADVLEPLLRLPVTVEHNVRAMALAESRFGLGKGTAAVAFVYLRTGLGAGLVVDGQPFSGGVHGALELGHMRTSDRGLPCVCGGSGCLETVVSDRALRARALRAGVDVDHEESPLAALVDAAARGSEDAERAVSEVVSQMAIGLSAMASLLNPDVFFLGGAFADMPADFLHRLREQTSAALFPVLRSSLRVEATSLGADAGVIGGGSAALDRYLYDVAVSPERDKTITLPTRSAASA